MKIRKIPMRTCVITKERLPKQELIRVVRMPGGVVTIDETGKVNGRGAYVKKDLEVIKKARISKILERNLETSIDEEIYDKLEKMC